MTAAYVSSVASSISVSETRPPVAPSSFCLSCSSWRSCNVLPIRIFASSSRSTKRTVSPERVLNFLPSSPHTSPKGTWSSRVASVAHPAALAASKTSSKWGAWPASVT